MAVVLRWRLCFGWPGYSEGRKGAMTLTFELPPKVEQVYLAHARALGVPVDELVREVLITNQPGVAGAREEGLGLFGSPEDSALLDEVVAMAMEDRRRPSSRA
jgi:hypothetical protein